MALAYDGLQMDMQKICGNWGICWQKYWNPSSGRSVSQQRTSTDLTWSLPNTYFSEFIGIVGLLLVKNIKHNHNHDPEFLKMYTYSSSSLENISLLQHKLWSRNITVCLNSCMCNQVVIPDFNFGRHALRFPGEKFSHSSHLYSFKSICTFFIHSMFIKHLLVHYILLVQSWESGILLSRYLNKWRIRLAKKQIQ